MELGQLARLEPSLLVVLVVVLDIVAPALSVLVPSQEEHVRILSSFLLQAETWLDHSHGRRLGFGHSQPWLHIRASSHHFNKQPSRNVGLVFNRIDEVGVGGGLQNELNMHLLVFLNPQFLVGCPSAKL